MRLIKVAAASLNLTPLDWDGNRRLISEALAQARREKISVLCLPELCITGYGCEDAFSSEDVLKRALDTLTSLLPETRGMVVSIGLPYLYQNAVLNTSALIADGQVLGLVAKKHLAGDGIHYEPRWFKPWPEGAVGEAAIDGAPCPIGDLIFEVGGIRVGFEICEDAWVAGRPGVKLALHGADIILNPSASHFAFGKGDVRKRFVIEGSRAFGVAYVYANLLGCESGRAIYDGGNLIASEGRLIARGRRLSFRDIVLTSAIVDVSNNRMSQARKASFVPELRNTDLVCVRSGFDIPQATREPVMTDYQEQDWTASTAKNEEFVRAVSLGLFDYLRKSHTHGFVVSLSGGADSSAVACLVRTLVRFGVEELGLAGFKAKLGYLIGIQSLRAEPELMRALLLTVYQATKNSSETTRNAARGLSKELQATYRELDVDALYDQYVRMIQDCEDRPLTWEEDDTALQNIQARVRAPGVWLLANLRNSLLLCTSNRSEAAVGYATMDGDTAGSLSPIAGIDKAFLREWLRWMEASGPQELGPIKSLALVTQQQPTAELRPHEQAQTDEKDLMPYEVLDAIERLAIRDKKAPIECYEVLQGTFHDRYAAEDLGAWVERFFRLWARNQWKRERYAPSFHLDDENLDPKTWCRFPILSGGFEKELAELRSALG